jgi:hypothetical protein
MIGCDGDGARVERVLTDLEQLKRQLCAVAERDFDPQEVARYFDGKAPQLGCPEIARRTIPAASGR